MRTLYIFGDSFTVDYKTDWTWTRQLADKLRVDAMMNNSNAPAASNNVLENFH